MADYGFKYSLPGKKLLPNTNNREIGFSSKFTTLKTFLTGTISIAASASGYTTKEIRHELSYRSAFMAYFKDTASGEVYQCESGFENVAFNRSGAEINVHAKVDPYNLTLVVYNNTAGTKNVDVFYEIFYEDLTTEPILFV